MLIVVPIIDDTTSQLRSVAVDDDGVLLMIAVVAVMTMGVLTLLTRGDPGRHRASSTIDYADDRDTVASRPSPRPWWCG